MNETDEALHITIADALSFIKRIFDRETINRIALQKCADAYGKWEAEGMDANEAIGWVGNYTRAAGFKPEKAAPNAPSPGMMSTVSPNSRFFGPPPAPAAPPGAWVDGSRVLNAAPIKYCLNEHRPALKFACMHQAVRPSPCETCDVLKNPVLMVEAQADLCECGHTMNVHYLLEEGDVHRYCVLCKEWHVFKAKGGEQ